jgi:hypothetical protein
MTEDIPTTVPSEQVLSEHECHNTDIYITNNRIIEVQIRGDEQRRISEDSVFLDKISGVNFYGKEDEEANISDIEKAKMMIFGGIGFSIYLLLLDNFSNLVCTVIKPLTKNIPLSCTTLPILILLAVSAWGFILFLEYDNTESGYQRIEIVFENGDSWDYSFPTESETPRELYKSILKNR